MSLGDLARAIVRALIFVSFLLPPALAQADEPIITVMVANNTRTFTRSELLTRLDATTIEVARDVTGEVLFAVQCLPCHKLNGAGASDVGPDLNLPQNPTEYLAPQGLHDVIRDPRAVRAWPAMAMPPFPPDHLSDREIGLVIAYLKHMSGRKH